MIKSFKCKYTALLFKDNSVPRFHDIANLARRKLEILNAVTLIESLKVPPGNHLEKLLGDRKGYYSIRVNSKWRICFKWEEGNAYDVEIVDYH